MADLIKAIFSLGIALLIFLFLGTALFSFATGMRYSDDIKTSLKDFLDSFETIEFTVNGEVVE